MNLMTPKAFHIDKGGKNNFMEKVKYSIAVQTYMEVFDYLITNNLFVYDSGEDFLDARIKIGEYGFVEESQIRRGVWDEEQPKEKIIPTIRVLKVLTDISDDLLTKVDVPTSPDVKYAYLHDLKSKMGGNKSYYSSYQELLKIFKDVYNGQELLFNSDGKIVDFALVKYQQISNKFSKMTPVEKRTIECYAKLEEEIINCTSNLLLVDEYGYPLDELHRRIYEKNEPNVKIASKETQVNWQEFKDCILDNYEYQKEEGRFNLHGAYSALDSNQYKSELGLDGKTR